MDDVVVDVGFTHSLFPFYFFIVQYLVLVFLFTECVKIRVLC
jgi:cbb3-type cytochrome oxidase subunit 3